MYQDKGVMLVAVDLKEDPEKVKQFLNDQGLDLIVAMDKTGKVGRLYKASSIPTTVIVDKDGTIQAVHIGYMPGAEMTMKKELDQLLAGKKLADD